MRKQLRHILIGLTATWLLLTTTGAAVDLHLSLQHSNEDPSEHGKCSVCENLAINTTAIVVPSPALHLPDQACDAYRPLASQRPILSDRYAPTSPRGPPTT
jgi:hypothetical protein